MKSEFVLMDFDGVIANTFQLSLAIVQQVFPQETAQSLRTRLEGDANKTLSELASTNFPFFDKYSKHILEQPLAPGIVDALNYIGENFTVIIVSSTIGAPIKKYLAHHHLTNHFDAVFGNDNGTSKADKFALILKHYKLSSKEAVFVTDTLGDIHQAEQVGIPIIAVTWGYHNESTLQKGTATTIIDYPTQLKGAIEEALDFSGEYDE